jgi:hypothetical protein
VDGQTVHGTSIIVNLPWQPAVDPATPRKPFTLYFGIAENARPAPMKDHLLLLNSYRRPPNGDNFLYLQLNTAQDTWAAPKGRRALQVYGILPESELPRQELLPSLVQPVTEHLNRLMPFSDGVLTLLGDDLGETEAATRIPLRLAEQVRTIRTVVRDGASYSLTSLKNLYLLPDLGRRPVASLESARSAVELANLVVRNS